MSYKPAPEIVTVGVTVEPLGSVMVQTTALAFSATPELFLIVIPRATTSPRSYEAIIFPYLGFIVAEVLARDVAVADVRFLFAMIVVATERNKMRPGVLGTSPVSL
jgi:hypothetical protein